MTPKIRLRGPKLSNDSVTIHSEFNTLADGERVNKLVVGIRLPTSVLSKIKNEDQTSLAEANDSSELEMVSSDDDLSDLDAVLNKLLNPRESAETESIETDSSAVEEITEDITAKAEPIQTAKEEYEGYKMIPRNILPLLEQEFQDFGDEGDGDEFGILDKLVFTLKDPLTATRIKLPVKSNNCGHFECFDFENFCIFNQIPSGLKKAVLTSITQKNFMKLEENEARLQSQQKSPSLPKVQQAVKVVNNPIPQSFTKSLYSRPAYFPEYKCPRCDKKFILPDLSICHVFNYFLKATPKDSERIELVDLKRFRVLSNSYEQEKKNVEELIILSDEEDDIVIAPPPVKKDAPISQDVQAKQSISTAETSQVSDLPFIIPQLPKEQNSNTVISKAPPLHAFYPSQTYPQLAFRPIETTPQYLPWHPRLDSSMSNIEFDADLFDDGLDDDLALITSRPVNGSTVPYSSSDYNIKFGSQELSPHAPKEHGGSWEDPLVLD